MDILEQYMPQILTAISSLTSVLISVTSLIKSLQSEKRVIQDLLKAKDDVQITRDGIVKAFKNAVVTKDLKVSINNQVKEILAEQYAEFQRKLDKSEARKTKMTYWALKVLSYTAAADKITFEQRAEIDEMLAEIADEEQIVDTDIK